MGLPSTSLGLLGQSSIATPIPLTIGMVSGNTKKKAVRRYE